MWQEMNFLLLLQRKRLLPNKSVMLALRYFGDPILRKRAKEIEQIDDEIVKLVHDMEKAMVHYRGIGLAAPQVGHAIRLFIFRIDQEDEDGKVTKGDLRVFINPKLLEPSAKENAMKEGCLSLPGIREEVWRPSEITIEATNLQGETFKERFTGLEARCVMHENDHLNGTLFIDRLPMRARVSLEQTLRAIKNKYKK
jgi:peptide deformylase